MNKLTKKELLELAKRYEMRAVSRLKKSQLVDLLEEYLKKNSSEDYVLLDEAKEGRAESSPGRYGEAAVYTKAPDVPEYYDQDMLFMFPVNPKKQFAAGSSQVLPIKIT